MVCGETSSQFKAGFVRGKGRHKVELKFRVPVTGPGGAAGGIHQARFTAPPLVQNRLVFRTGPGITSLQAPVREGGSTSRRARWS